MHLPSFLLVTFITTALAGAVPSPNEPSSLEPRSCPSQCTTCTVGTLCDCDAAATCTSCGGSCTATCINCFKEIVCAGRANCAGALNACQLVTLLEWLCDVWLMRGCRRALALRLRWWGWVSCGRCVGLLGGRLLWDDEGKCRWTTGIGCDAMR